MLREKGGVVCEKRLVRLKAGWRRQPLNAYQVLDLPRNFTGAQLKQAHRCCFCPRSCLCYAQVSDASALLGCITCKHPVSCTHCC